MLEARRNYVHEGPSNMTEAMLCGSGSGSLIDIFTHARSLPPDEVRELRQTLTQLGGALLFLLHPEDEAVTGTTDPYENMSEPGPGHLRMAGPFHVVQGLGEDGEPYGLPLPLPAGARVHIIEEAAIWTSDGMGGWDKRPHLEQSTPLYPAGYYAREARRG